MKTVYESEDIKLILQDFKDQIVKEFESKIQKKVGILDYKLLKNKDLKKILSVSDSTIENLRNNGYLPHTKLMGTYYYYPEDVNSMLEKNKLNFKNQDHE
jgi:hypothetical protein